MIATRTSTNTHDRTATKLDRKEMLKKLSEYIELAERKEMELEIAKRKWDAYNYRILKFILHEVGVHIANGVKVNPRSTYILPGAIWMVKSLLEGKKSLDEVAGSIGAVRYLSVKLFRKLVEDKNLTLLIPSNLSLKDVNIYLWTDKVGYDSEGNPMYMLTMYFSFPFDIHELDKRSEYEPVSVLFVKRGSDYVPVKAYARVHYDLYVYDLENQDTLKIMFMRSGHTPKVMSKEVARVSSSNIIKETLDKAWLVVGEFVTRLFGVRAVKVKEEKESMHVYISYRLPKTKNNVFSSPVHPYFVDVTI